MPLPRIITRRELLRLTSGALGVGVLGFGMDGIARATPPLLPDSPQNPTPYTQHTAAVTTPVAIGRCDVYEPTALKKSLASLADQIGGLKSLVDGKTVAIKINVTGGPGRWRGMPPGATYHVHPLVVQGVVTLLAEAGAKRVRILESAPHRGNLEEFLIACGWNISTLTASGGSATVEFENTRNLGQGKRYSRLKVPGGGLLYPAYDLNHAYEDADVVVSLAKLKTHAIAGVTGATKNMFGITPNSLYGSDAGSSGNEEATSYRGDILHEGTQAPPSGMPSELAAFDHDPTRRVPRIIVDLVRARPVDLCVIDGITSVAGGEGPWQPTLRPTKPHVLLMGRNPICTDAVATAVMGYDPTAASGTDPFPCDNHLALAAAAGIGTNVLDKIDVRGLTLAAARYPYGPNR